ncbi:MAG: AMP-dependent synthetase and ligase [Candidatus Sulfotelmatobacter sp.]|nr:AMP-dependent synthetase and ligase [Candidatus Sulfotelmatobacter sp.]
MAESLSEFLLANFQARPNERAYGQRRGYRMVWFTYGQVLDMASKFCRELEARGIGRGERVMLWGENSGEWVAAFFGCATSGVIVVPMDDGASRDFASRVSRHVGARLWVCSQRNWVQHADTFGGIPAFVLDDLSKELGQSPLNLVPDAGLGGNSPLQIVFTSGTTAEPKGVVITHGNVLANIVPLEREIQRYLKYERWVHPVRFLNLLPLSHVFGQFLGMFLPPLLGGTVIFQEELKPSEIVSTIRRERVSVLVSVPRVLQGLKQKVERDLEESGKEEEFRRRFRAAEGKHFLRRWWIFRAIRRQFGWKFWAFICGGAALDAESEQFWDRLGYAAIQGYGLTETTSLISVNHPFKLGKGSIGKVLPGREVKLAEDGEILIRGGGVAAGYWSAGQHEEVVDEEGWYRTGDVGALDGAGNLYFKGRKKEVIVTPAGLNIYPEDLEAALRLQPEVKDCVVVGLERGGNAEPCAVLIVRDDARVETVVERANQSLAEFQRVRMWVRWPQQDFPRTSTQKPRRNVIADFAAKQILQAGSNEIQSESPLADLISRVTGRSVGALNVETTLDSDLGLSSLDRVELISVLEDRYQVDLSEMRFSAARTVGDVERMLSGEERRRVVYHYPRWVLQWPVPWMRWLAHYLLMKPAMMLLGRPRIEGRENLREWNGPMLVVCNHIADVDVGFVQSALPWRWRHRIATATGGEALEALRTPASDRSMFRRIYDRMQWLLGVSLLNLFPLPREAGFRQSFAYAGEAVDRGYSVLVFPEGRHTVDGKINPFRAGIGLLGKNLGVPVLPMRIVGLFEVKQSGKKFASPGRIQVRIGTPMKFAPEIAPERIAEQLESAVKAL